MEAILLAFTPLVVNVVTQSVKKVQTINFSANRVVLLRTIAGVLSFVSAVLVAMATGTEVDQSVIANFVETTLMTGIVYGLSQLYYYLHKKGSAV